MTKKEAEEVIALVARGRLNITYTNHFDERVEERVPGFTRLHAMNALRRGTLQGDPVRDDEHDNHKVKLRSTVTDFGKVEMLIGIKFLADAVGITIYGIKK